MIEKERERGGGGMPEGGVRRKCTPGMWTAFNNDMRVKQ